MTQKQIEQHKLAVAIFYSAKDLQKVVAKINGEVDGEYLAGAIRKKSGDKMFKQLAEMAYDLENIKKWADALSSGLRE